jgi:hypothetical protein
MGTARQVRSLRYISSVGSQMPSAALGFINKRLASCVRIVPLLWSAPKKSSMEQFAQPFDKASLTKRMSISREEQYARLKLVYMAPKLLRLTRTVQGIWNTRQFEMQKTHSRWERVLKDVTFYEFIAVLDGVRVKVIVKQVAGGEKHFWSVIPFWKVDDQNHRRILHSGDPEHD